ncbi:nitrilase-related carbon-nitrogen hydrolase [Streptomyces sp. NBC_00145]|uniref:nitrilase-related carbon-nitrogen hydrolase n=1 Tax=Streptomyces sp. NBC_00145 TaxID=2975666 RepID=UPI002E17ADD3
MSDVVAGEGRRLRVALTQWHATRDVARNVAVATQIVREAAAEHPDLILLPENGLMLGTNIEMRDAALSVDGPEIGALRDAAATAGCAVVVGGMKRRDDSEELYNTALFIASDGSVTGGYDKIHLFDARVNGQSFEASNVERAGAAPVLALVNGVKVGITICYDVRFPELYRRLALAGAEVVLVPAAFTRTTGQAHWEVLLRARAIENAAFVVASATVRGEEDAFETYGHALAVDPWGAVLADLGEEKHAWQVVDLDLGKAVEARQTLPVLRGVRPDAYAADVRIIGVH